MKTDSHPTSRPGTRLILLAVSLLILVLGAVENLYGNTDDGDVYGSDAVQYLDIARAIERHDTLSALNPLWSQGYPALLAAERPLYPAGPGGDWAAVRVLNFSIFAANYAAFLYLVFGLLGAVTPDASPRRQRRTRLLWVSALCLFAASQVCLGQVSRVNPDELVTTCFFLACALVVRLLRSGNRPLLRGLLLGLVLGVGFIVKAVFLVLGMLMLMLLGAAMLWARRSRGPVIAAALIFGLMAGLYGGALSHAVGHRTLGESGAINYAWHVDRLHKWVHWEGRLDPAPVAWPKPWIARFAHWESDPPDLGAPVHPSVILQESPRVYGFAAPIHATYVPYYNPPYWYTGYKRVVRLRFQLIAIVKSLIDLAQVLAKQPIFYATLVSLLLLLGTAAARRAFAQWLLANWYYPLCGLLAVAIYVPVHLEGRYLAGFLALVALSSLIGGTADVTALTAERTRLVTCVMLLGLGADLAIYQVPVWRNMLHRKAPQKNEEWKIGEAVLAEHLPSMSQVGVLGWTANLHSDWAYIAQLQITSEIASPADIDLFWRQTPEEQARTLDTFRNAGAVAVFTRGKPAGNGSPEWTRLGETTMWMLRLVPATQPSGGIR